MKAPPFMQLYVGDYLADAGHLNALEHGAYLLLLMAGWRSDGLLPRDDASLMRLARCTPRQWRAVREVVLAFFEDDGETLSQRRQRTELLKYVSHIEKKKNAGSAGGKAKALKNQEADLAPAKQTLEKNLAKRSYPEPEPEEKNPIAPSGLDGVHSLEEENAQARPLPLEGQAACAPTVAPGANEVEAAKPQAEIVELRVGVRPNWREFRKSELWPEERALAKAEADARPTPKSAPAAPDLPDWWGLMPNEMTRAQKAEHDQWYLDHPEALRG